MEKFTVERVTALKKNLYCKKYGGWIYCSEAKRKKRSI